MLSHISLQEGDDREAGEMESDAHLVLHGAAGFVGEDSDLLVSSSTCLVSVLRDTGLR